MKYTTVFTILFTTALQATTCMAQCRGDDQPYANRCISKQMSDYIACVESTGGNRSEIGSIIQNSGNSDSAAAAAAALSTKGRLVSGSTTLKLSHQSELSALKQVELKYFAGGTSTCSEFAQAIEHRTPTRAELHFPMTRTASGDRVVFFDKFIVQIDVFSKVDDKPTAMEIETPENGRVYLNTGAAPVDVSYNGVNYHLSARETNNKLQPELVLGR